MKNKQMRNFTTALIVAGLLAGALALTFALSKGLAQDDPATDPAPVAPPAAGAGGLNAPIDIQATEQEFEGDKVIAKGKVKVVYKDSVILGTQATMFKDANGQMQTAVFVGHPYLTQLNSKMDADTITFELANSKVTAQGHAHSEVISHNDDSGKVGEKATAETNPGSTQTIFTDSDDQEYDRDAGKFVASGHVKVLNGDINATSEKMHLIYGTTNKPETCIFTGNAHAVQGNNSTKADTITYFMPTKRLQATGHASSKVIQQKTQQNDSNGVRKVSSTDSSSGDGTSSKASTSKVATTNVSTGKVATPTPIDTPAQAATTTGAAPEVSDETITIVSDSQDLSRDTGRITAEGRVKVYYKETIGMGPKCIILRNEEGKPEKVYYIGRSQVLQPGKRWIADHITFNCADQKVIAVGNSKAVILQTPTVKPEPAPPPTSDDSELAQTTGDRNKAISTLKVVNPQ